MDINIGGAYSAGFFIFIAGTRFAYPSSFLYHEGSTCNGRCLKFRNQAGLIRNNLTNLKAHPKYKASEADYERILKDDYWLTAP